METFYVLTGAFMVVMGFALLLLAVLYALETPWAKKNLKKASTDWIVKPNIKVYAKIQSRYMFCAFVICMILALFLFNEVESIYWIGLALVGIQITIYNHLKKRKGWIPRTTNKK